MNQETGLLLMNLLMLSPGYDYFIQTLLEAYLLIVFVGHGD